MGSFDDCGPDAAARLAEEAEAKRSEFAALASSRIPELARMGAEAAAVAVEMGEATIDREPNYHVQSPERRWLFLGHLVLSPAGTYGNHGPTFPGATAWFDDPTALAEAALSRIEGPSGPEKLAGLTTPAMGDELDRLVEGIRQEAHDWLRDLTVRASRD